MYYMVDVILGDMDLCIGNLKLCNVYIAGTYAKAYYVGMLDMLNVVYMSSFIFIFIIDVMGINFGARVNNCS